MNEKENRLYSIGKAAEICDVSQRTLRYYEERGLIKPDRISESRYRYYGAQTMRTVQVIRYYVEEGFSLDEVEEILNVKSYDDFQAIFEKHMEDTKAKIRFYHQRLDSMTGWYNLIVEGKRVLKYSDDSVRMRYIPETLFFYIAEEEADFQDREREAELEIKYLSESKANGHSMIDVGGAFIVWHESSEKRINSEVQKIKIMQTAYPNSESDHGTIRIDGFNAICTYHIGSLDNIADSYRRAIEWAEEHNFVLKHDCYEKRILDIYSTDDESNYVTEIILPIEDDCRDIKYAQSSAEF